MASLKSFSDVLVRSTELWGTGQHSYALRLIDEWIAKAEQNKESYASIQFLRMHASLIAGAMDDLALARRYCEQVLSSEPENALALYTLADAMLRQGEKTLARNQAARAYALVCHSSSYSDRDLSELLIKRWPELKGG